MMVKMLRKAMHILIICASLSVTAFGYGNSGEDVSYLILPDLVPDYPAATASPTDTPSAPSAAPSFTDVLPNDWFREAVAWAVSSGVTNGTGGTTFSPYAPCNRAQMVTFLWRAAGSPAPKGSAARFADVKPDDYFAEAVAWAVENGVTNGTGNAAFSPLDPVSRAEAVTFLWRAQGKPAAAAGKAYADVEAGSYYADAVAWASAANVTNGTGSGFEPSLTVNRATCVTFLWRVALSE